MNKLVSRSLWAAVWLLSSCGGGGGGAGSDNDWLTLEPSSISSTVFEGESSTLTITARASKTVSGVFNVGIIDSVGVLDAQGTTVQAVTATTYAARLTVHPRLAVGTHTGRFEVRLCRDDPTVCAQPIEGSPWQVPYTITVRSSTNLSPLQPLAGAGSWQTYQGSARHNGHVAATVDATQFNRRFRYTTTGSEVASDTAVDSGLVVLATGKQFDPWTLHGVDEATGRPVWTAPMGPLHLVNAPAMAGGKVFVTSTGHQDTFFWTFDAASGTQQTKVPMSSQWEHYQAPTLADGAVYTNSGSYGGMSRFNAQTGQQDWFIQSLPQVDGWTPAVEGGLAYVVMPDRLWALNVVDGSTAFNVSDNSFAGFGHLGSAPVLTDGGVVFAAQRDFFEGRLVRFDTVNRTISWWVGTKVKSQPVVVGDTVYVLDGRELQARSATTGTLLWAWTSPVEFGMRAFGPGASDPVPLIVVGRYAFFSTFEGTKALDLISREIAWSDPASGHLAVSANGVLYISGITTVPMGEGLQITGTALTAINLR